MDNGKTTIRHICVNIAGFLRNNKNRDVSGFFEDETGREMSDSEIRSYLNEELAKGHKIVPGNPKCEGFDPFGGGCPGHTAND